MNFLLSLFLWMACMMFFDLNSMGICVVFLYHDNIRMPARYSDIELLRHIILWTFATQYDIIYK